ncbi:MAG: aldo/keto reductase, partial [Armatimonadetes bacterium]|nr:aldo/keto reductase [Armatimonadota bacterium]
MDEITRREFLKRAAAAPATLGIASLAASDAEAAEQRREMPMRNLGKTGVKVSALGFGGGSIFLQASEEQAAAMLEQAFAAGITYFDTAADYGSDRQSEKRYGKVLPRFRKQIFLATKTANRTYDGAMRSVEESLKALNTDRLDLIQMHDVGPSDDPTKWERPDGALTALRKLQEQKVVRFVGFTGHQQ